MSRGERQSHRGQIIVLFTLALVGLLLVVGLTVDGGYALAQRRTAQNAADFAAIAGTRVVGEFLTGDTTNGTDGNVKQAVEAALVANGANVADYAAQYVTEAGTAVGQVGASAIPASAQGVVVNASTTWNPYFLGIMGVQHWSAGANAVAMSPGTNVGVGVMPFGVSAKTLGAYDACPLGETVGSGSPGCTTFHLTPGSLNLPGGFGWLKFGCYNNKDADGKHYGLGQVLPAASGGCSPSKPFLDGEWGSLPTTPGNTYGCCTSIAASTAAGFGNDIGSLPGNKASINDGQTSVDYIETNNLVGWVPIWDSANGNGNNGYYHIIGYAGFQIVHIKGGKDIEGVIRLKDGPGPSGTYDTPDPSLLTSFDGTVQLIH